MPLSPNELNRYKKQCPPKGQEECCSGNKCTSLQPGEVIVPCNQRSLLIKEETKLNGLNGAQRNAQAKKVNAIRNGLTEIWGEACGRKTSGGKKTRNVRKNMMKSRKNKTRV